MRYIFLLGGLSYLTAYKDSPTIHDMSKGLFFFFVLYLENDEPSTF